MPLTLKRTSVFCDGLDHPECIAVARDGTFYAGGEAGQIYQISPDGGRIEQIADTEGFVLGIAISPDGRWLAACDLKHKCVWKLDLPGRTLSEFACGGGGGSGGSGVVGVGGGGGGGTGADGTEQKFNIPNHLAFLPDGTLFITDSGGFRQVSGRIFRFDSDGNGYVWHPGPFNFPNGIAIAPDGGALYVVCSWLPGVERIEIRADGSPGKRSVYARIPAKSLPDGLAFDARGNLYVSCYTPARIYKIGRGDRKVSVLIDDWEAHTLANPTNIAFGGKHFDQLFAANLGRWHITQIDLRVRGAPLACHRNGGTASR